MLPGLLASAPAGGLLELFGAAAVINSLTGAARRAAAPPPASAPPADEHPDGAAGALGALGSFGALGALGGAIAGGGAGGGGGGGGGAAAEAAAPPAPRRYVNAAGVLTNELPAIAPLADNGAHWRDLPFALAFYAQLVLVCAAAVMYGVPAVTADTAAAAHDGAAMAARAAAGNLRADALLRAVAAGGAAALVAAVALVWVLRAAPARLISACMWGSVAVQAVSGASLLLISPEAGATLLLLAVLSAAYAYAVRARIAFAAAHVAAAAEALEAAAAPLGAVAVALLAAQTAWTALWLLAALGAQHEWLGAARASGDARSSAQASTQAGTLILFALLISYFWVAATINNIGDFVAASVTGSWWFGAGAGAPAGAPPPAPVRGAVRRALTTSFGSLALGGLVLALCAALRELLARGRARAGGSGPAAVLLGCVLDAASALARWANAWSIPYAALSGLALAPAGAAAITLFERRGWSAVVNADLVGVALAVGSLAAASAAALAGAVVSVAAGGGTANAPTTAALCFAIGLTAAAVVAAAVRASTRTIFVAFAMAPGALDVTHPRAASALRDAWAATHGDVFTATKWAAPLAGTPLAGATLPALLAGAAEERAGLLGGV